MKKIGLGHFYFLLDDFGIWQHTIGNEIDRKMGYALDDSARALVLTSLLRLRDESKIFLNYISLSLKNNCNFFDYLRSPVNFPISDDALGQAYWAVNLCLESNISSRIAEKLLRDMLARVKKIKNIRGKCYAILGTVISDINYAKELSDDLKSIYKTTSTNDWPWIENALTYGNAIIPYALLSIAHSLNDSESKEIGIKMIDFLNMETKHKGMPIAVGNHNWYWKNGKKSLFDQQPIDPAYQILANTKAYDVTGDTNYLKEACTYYEWFFGNNIVKLPLIDLNDSSCKDGIMQNGLSPNKGSENIVCFLIGQHKILSFEHKQLSFNYSKIILQKDQVIPNSG